MKRLTAFNMIIYLNVLEECLTRTLLCRHPTKKLWRLLTKHLTKPFTNFRYCLKLPYLSEKCHCDKSFHRHDNIFVLK